MFGKFFRAFAADSASSKAIHVLMKTYSLVVSHPDQIKMMSRIALDYGGLLNEHEMAVQFLAEFSRDIDTEHPGAKSEIEKYIRMSKGAYNRGLASNDAPQQSLFEVARDRFGVEPNDIAAA